MYKKVCLYGILTALCLVLGWVEGVLSLNFIAPGIKLGLANTVALLLILKGDIKGAFLVNIARILLSVLLFSQPSTLIYSLTAGIVSLTAVILLRRIKSVGVIGFSIVSAVVHNITQLFIAALVMGSGVWLYLPILLISAIVCGMFTGFIAGLVFKRL